MSMCVCVYVCVGWNCGDKYNFGLETSPSHRRLLQGKRVSATTFYLVKRSTPRAYNFATLMSAQQMINGLCASVYTAMQSNETTMTIIMVSTPSVGSYWTTKFAGTPLSGPLEYVDGKKSLCIISCTYIHIYTYYICVHLTILVDLPNHYNDMYV